MHTLFLLNPTAGKTDCTQQLPQQINAAAARAGLAPEEYTIRITTHAGHARELRRQVDRAVEQALANRIAAGTACAGQHWTADCAADGSIVLREDETVTL